MRSVARLKMEYYPLPESEAAKLRSLLVFPEPASVIHVWGRESLLISSRKKRIFAGTASNSMPIVYAWRMLLHYNADGCEEA